MPTRRIWLTSCTVAALAYATAVPLSADEIASLADQLKMGLRARQPAEFTFCARVAALVDEGKLPRDYVMAVFKWSRLRRPNFPLPYFQRAIEIKAEELDVEL